MRTARQATGAGEENAQENPPKPAVLIFIKAICFFQRTRVYSDCTQPEDRHASTSQVQMLL